MNYYRQRNHPFHPSRCHFKASVMKGIEYTPNPQDPHSQHQNLSRNGLLCNVSSLDSLPRSCANQIIPVGLVLHQVSVHRISRTSHCFAFGRALEKKKGILTNWLKLSISTIFDLAQESNASQFTHSCLLYTREVGSASRQNMVASVVSPRHMAASRQYSRQWSTGG